MVDVIVGKTQWLQANYKEEKRKLHETREALGVKEKEVIRLKEAAVELGLQIEKLQLSNETRDKRLTNLTESKEDKAERIIQLEDKLAM